MTARAKKKNERKKTTVEAPIQWDRGWSMIVLGSMCFMTAIGFDTALQGTFDLSKLVYLYLGATLLILGWVFNSLKTGEFVLARTPLDLPVAATFGAIVLSTLFAVDPRCSFFGAYKNYEGAAQLVVYLILFYAAARLRRSEVIVVISMIVVAAFGAGVYGLEQRLGFDSLGWSKLIEGRVISTFGNPVFFGVFIVLAVPLAAGLALWKPEKRPKEIRSSVLWISGLALTFFLVTSLYPAVQTYRGAESVSSLSRALVLIGFAIAITVMLGRRLLLRPSRLGWNRLLGWLFLALALVLNGAFYCSKSVGALGALGIGMLLFFGFLWFRHGELGLDRTKLIVLMTGLVVINLGFNLWPETSTLKRFSGLVTGSTPKQKRELSEQPAAKTFAPAGSFYKRTLLYRTGFNIIRNYPFFGVGPDGIERVVAQQWSAEYQLDYGRLVQVEGFENRVHNELIEIAATQGLVGLAARLWLWVAVFLMVWRARSSLPGGDYPVLAGLGSAWLVLVAAMVFEYPTIPISTATWVVLGCLVAWIKNDPQLDVFPERRMGLPAKRGLLWVAIVGLIILLGWFWKVAALDSYRADRHYMKAEILKRSKRVTDSVGEYEKAVALNPHLHIYSEKLCATLISLTAQASSEKKELMIEHAIDAAQLGVENSPWRGSGFAFLATGQGMLADFYSKQIDPPTDEIERLRAANLSNLKKAIEVNPYNAGLRTAYARHSLRARDWDTFTEIAIAVLDWWPFNKLMIDLIAQGAAMMAQEKMPERAIELLVSAESRVHEKGRPKLLYGFGRAYWVGKNWKELERVGAEMLAINANDAEGYRNLAVAHVQMKQFDRAERECRRLLEIKKDDEYGVWLLRMIEQLKKKSRAVQIP